MKKKMIVGLSEKSITLLGPISIKDLNEIVEERSLQDFTITGWHNWEEPAFYPKVKPGYYYAPLACEVSFDPKDKISGIQ